MSSHLTRRSLLGLAAGAAVAVAAGCQGGGQQGGQPSGSTSDGAWSFTDDTGVTAQRPSRPVRIAGLTDQVAALWNLGIAPIATFGQVSAKGDPQFDGKDLSAVTELGTSYGQIDLEKLAELAPDLIVTHAYPDGKGGLEKLLYGFADQTQLEKARAIAPVVAIAQQGSVDDIAGRQDDLARSLGVAQSELDRAAQEFRSAGDQLREAASNGVRAVYLAAYATDGVYYARAADDPSLRYYTETLGLGYPKVAGSTFYWDHLSWEKVDRYPVDVVLASTRAMGKAELMKQPTFAKLPVARAGQVYPRAFYPTDHRGQAQAMTSLADLIRGARTLG